MGFLDTFKHTLAPRGSGLPGNAPKSSPPADSMGFNTDRPAIAIKAQTDSEQSVVSLVLFVATGTDWHQRIERELGCQLPQWGCRMAGDVAQAVKALRNDRYLAVVMDATVATDTALAAVLQHESAHSLRIVICDFSNRATLAKLGATGATPLPRNTDAATLVATIHRLAFVQHWMSDAGMKKLLAQCRRLPTMPRLYSEATAELSSPTSSLEVVGKLIGQDPVMTAKILQMVNSAYFGLRREITDPYEAVLFMGAERTRSLLLLAGVFMQFEGLKCPGYSGEQIWHHSLQVGVLARTITLAEVKNVKLAETAFTVGLIHDMGKLILMANVPAMCAAIDRLQSSKQLTQREAEREVLGTTHAELAACLLGTWGLALPVLEAVAWHHCPTRSSDQDFSLLTAVHAANVFAHESDACAETTAMPERFDHQYLLRIERGERRNDWRKACGVPLRQEEDFEHARARQRRDAKEN